MTNEVIADELAMPIWLLSQLKKYYDKLGIQTKQEGTMVSFSEPYRGYNLMYVLTPACVCTYTRKHSSGVVFYL
jgi:hypothetical protein